MMDKRLKTGDFTAFFLNYYSYYYGVRYLINASEQIILKLFHVGLSYLNNIYQFD